MLQTLAPRNSAGLFQAQGPPQPMFAALILAAGTAALSPGGEAARPTRTTDQRLSLMEARQMLQSQTLWQLQAAVPPEAARALNDLDLHLQEDRERDEKMQQLQSQVSLLEQRLQAIELMLGDRPLAETGAMRAAPPPAQTSTMILTLKPQAKQARAPHKKSASPAPKSRAERLSAQLP